MSGARVPLRLWWCALFAAAGCGDDTGAAPDAGHLAPHDAGSRQPDESTAEPTTPSALRAAYMHSVSANALSPFSVPCPEADADDVECSRVTVPVSWQQPILGLISLLQRRLPAQAAPQRQLWLLGDGPGEPSAGLLAHARALAAVSPDTEVRWLDYRGVGGSERLSCASEEGAGGRLEGLDPPSDEGIERVERCFAEARVRWANDIFFFSLTETAADFAALVEAAREPELPVFVYGFGWGARVAHESLHLFADGLDGLVFDGLVPPDGGADRDAAGDAVLSALLELCAEHADCAARLGQDATAFARQVLDGVEQGECPELVQAGLDGYGLRRLLGKVAVRPELWGLAPAALYRAGRCAPADVQALVALAGSLADPVEQDAQLQPSDALALLQLVALGESRSLDQVEAAQAQLLSLDGRARQVASFSRVTPMRTPNAFAGEWAEPQAPALWLQGGLDATLTMAEAAAVQQRFETLGQPGLRVPAAGTGFGLRHDCGRQLLSAWLLSPGTAPVADCLSELAPSLELDAATVRARLGGAELWGD